MLWPTTSQIRNALLLIIAGLLFFLAASRSDTSKKERKLQAEVNQLQDSLFKKELEYAALETKITAMDSSILFTEGNIGNIPIKYIYVKNYYDALPADSSVRAMSGWLGRIPVTGRISVSK